MTPTDPTQCITERLDVALELIELTQEQSEAIAGDQMNELMRILGVKQRLIERFVTLSKSLASQHAAGQLSDLPEEIRQMHRVTEAKYATLLELEKSCEATLLERRDGLGEELSALAVAGQAAATYAAGATPAEGQRLDLGAV